MRGGRARTHIEVILAAVLALLAIVGGCSPASVGASRDTGPSAAPSGTASGNAPVTTSAPATPAVTTSHARSGSDAVSARPGTGSDSVTSPPPTSAAPENTSSTAPAQSTPPSQKTRIIASPPLGSTGISPTEPLAIRVAGGTIRALTFANPSEGIKVNGALSPDRTRWTLGEALGYGKTYTVSGSAVGKDGAIVPIKGTYSTATPKTTIGASISPGDNAVVGVAAPIIIRFSAPPPNRASIERHITINTSTPVTGAWAWVTHDGDTYPSLDFRPKTYWPEHTKVHVEADLYGLRLTDGTYGGDDVTVDFTIGRNQVVIADATTKKMVVQRDGRTVATYPASYGMGDDPDSRYGINPDLVTRSGTHIVMDKKPKVLMSLPKYGYTNIPEYWDVRISDNGEFIHENPTTVADQGFLNVTHGCINLSPASAKAYYQTAIYGDPVEVSGTSVKLSPKDGDIFDWAVSWPVWTSLSNRGEFTTASS